MLWFSNTSVNAPSMPLSPVVKGALWLVLSTFLFTTVNTLLKFCEQTYSPIEVVFFRNFFAVPIFLLLGKPEWRYFKSSHFLKQYFGYVVIGTITLVCLFESVRLLPIAESTILIYSSTFFVILFSGPLLKEWPSYSSWISVIIGFVGVSLIANPSFDFLPLGAAYGVLAAAFQALWMLRTRALSRQYNDQMILVGYGVIASALTALLLPFVGKWPTPKDWVFLIILGLGGGLGQYCLTVAYRLAKGSVLAPVMYTSIIWAAIYGFIFFDDKPALNLLIGASLVILSGLYIIRKS